MEMEAALVHAGIGAGSSALIGLALYGAKKMYKFLKVKYNYVKHIEKNFDNLEKELKVLCAMEEEEKSKLIRRKRKMKLMVMGESWLQQVKRIKDDVEALEIEYQSQSEPKFLFGVYPAAESVKLGKRIGEKTEVISLKSQIKEIPMMVEEAPTSILGKLLKLFRN